MPRDCDGCGHPVYVSFCRVRACSVCMPRLITARVCCSGCDSPMSSWLFEMQGYVDKWQCTGCLEEQKTVIIGGYTKMWLARGEIYWRPAAQRTSLKRSCK